MVRKFAKVNAVPPFRRRTIPRAGHQNVRHNKSARAFAPTMASDRIVAVGLLTQANVDLLGPTLTRVWPVQDAPCFSGLLHAIDEADREFRRSGSTNPDESQ
jgi:hypothetical protein